MFQPELKLGNAQEVVQSIASTYGSDSLRIKDGIVNYVGIIDEQLVVKAPKSERSMGSLVVEAAALDLLERSEALTAPVPRLVAFSSDPAYLLSTYIPGRVIEDSSSLNKLSVRDREALGRTIGTFILSQAERIDVQTARQEIPPLGKDDTWESLFEESLSTFSSPDYPSLSKLAPELYSQWLEHRKGEASSQFIHGDMRLGNIAISEDNKLIGVFDFGRAGTGDASCEISPLVNINPDIMKGVIDELRTAAVDVDMEGVHLWDEMKKLLQVTYGVSSPTIPSFVPRACRIIATRHPKLDWSEFEQLQSIIIANGR